MLLALAAACLSAQPVVLGSKRFTESYVLGEIGKRLLTEAGIEAQHKQGMGGTIVLWEALLGGQIQAYPEYTGTIAEEILKAPRIDEAEMKRRLAARGIGMSPELGFNNTYALVMTRKRADKLGIARISDLTRHSDLVAGPTHEFLGRQDGWKSMARVYGLTLANVRGLDHALGYAALTSGEIDLKDAYSTDAKIAELNLKLLEDDLRFFPSYRAVWLYRLDAPEAARSRLDRMGGTLDEAKMTALNLVAEQKKDYTVAAAGYFQSPQAPEARPSLASEILRWTARHLQLVGISLLLAILVGIPLGIVASRPGALSGFILGSVGVLQTIPSLALLALLIPIPFFGISATSAIFALFLYSLLPIVRNTANGLRDIPAPLRESAAALGLPPSAQLRKVYLPMASSSILAGIKTSAVINVGTATLAALIGAGGLGEPIVSGLNLNDPATILKGAVPAAVLALLVQLAFDGFDRVLIPKGLRLLRR